MSLTCTFHLYHLTAHSHNLVYDIWLRNPFTMIIFLIKLPKTSITVYPKAHLCHLTWLFPFFLRNVPFPFFFQYASLKNQERAITKGNPKLTSFKKVTGISRDSLESQESLSFKRGNLHGHEIHTPHFFFFFFDGEERVFSNRN